MYIYVYVSYMYIILHSQQSIFHLCHCHFTVGSTLGAVVLDAETFQRMLIALQVGCWFMVFWNDQHHAGMFFCTTLQTLRGNYREMDLIWSIDWVGCPARKLLPRGSLWEIKTMHWRVHNPPNVWLHQTCRIHCSMHHQELLQSFHLQFLRTRTFTRRVLPQRTQRSKATRAEVCTRPLFLFGSSA